ncbi:NADH dehydrogenase [ubiquinone] iron-sulfur protein 6, mitochondrial [Acyrthosiphon pisum]|uniref:NADH dehydrogenase [ubiquinone] iron-sulfur protein 6, mitochondrial n=1 Tax=Acyrthosiphon pisum TaxID=7029 RepID=C4WS83_ACYPI|nr:NADH dehydrogenase [ubiquinone] iron-sulfur protein 6, mitochondrial [Acyrthosiphon pisum]BAH70753.1 ACYPI000747 [Acyrthosiphon pisum]|eukprot:NP_001280386.1 NADH dehydrogenase [ubiquinone] iron-sulfur protein 6, mitochondrial [Acyrthosiphon pisum]
MALTVSGLKIAAVGLTQRACRPTLLQAAKYSWEPKEVEAHTGQKWEKDDYRLARFIDKKKEVNQSFAIDLIKQVPPKPCTERVVYCDGGGGPLGHPKVYINLDKPGNHACGYCGLQFVKKDSH